MVAIARTIRKLSYARSAGVIGAVEDGILPSAIRKWFELDQSALSSMNYSDLDDVLE